MSENLSHLRVDVIDGRCIARISAEQMEIEPRWTFTEDAIERIRELIREEIAASKVMPEVRVTLEEAEDGILERVTRTAGEVTDRFRLQR